MKNRLKKLKIQKSRYAMYDFIEAVETQAVLWQRDHDDYYNREKREVAWNEVARRLNENFDECTEDEKRRTVEILTRRWKNTRDCFFRALRHTTKRSYIYEQKMAFLLSNKPPTCSRNSRRKKVVYDDEDTVDHIESTVECLETQPIMDDAQRKGKKRPSSNMPKKTQMAKKKQQQSRPPNTDSEASNHSDPLLIAQFMKTSGDERSLSPQNQKSDHYMEDADYEVISLNNSSIPVINMAATLPNSSTLLNSNTMEPDPDQAFFDSIKPVMRGMNLNQKLDFQIEVLQLLKIYRKSQ